MEITDELIAKARECRNTGELLALAAENDVELTEEEARLFIEEFNEGELADEELDNVSGGGACIQPANTYDSVLFEREQDVKFIFNIGDQVQALAKGCSHHTATCIVKNRRVYREMDVSPVTDREFTRGYYDQYYLAEAPGNKSWFSDDWYFRSRIEK